MNEQQRDYAKAKQAKRRVEMKMEAREKSFLKGRGLMDSEGTEADSLYKIEDEALFDMACKEFDLLPGIPELNKEYARAGEALRAAEEALVEYALSIAPPATARTLRESAKNNYTIRQGNRSGLWDGRERPRHRRCSGGAWAVDFQSRTVDVGLHKL